MQHRQGGCNRHLRLKIVAPYLVKNRKIKLQIMVTAPATPLYPLFNRRVLSKSCPRNQKHNKINSFQPRNPSGLRGFSAFICLHNGEYTQIVYQRRKPHWLGSS